MIDISKGRYWDQPWSLVDGCTPCSPGCDHCWSAGMTYRFFQSDGGASLAVVNPDHPDGKTPPFFTGRIITHPERLSIPLQRRKPTIYAVWNDLFHEAVPEDFIDSVFNQIGFGAIHHGFLILTKRPERMRAYSERLKLWCSHQNDPFPNVYWGLTVCNQEEADAKIPVFLKVSGKKFLSIEPCLGPILIGNYLRDLCGLCNRQGKRPDKCDENFHCLTESSPKMIDAVILGGETGPGSRPMHPDWVRSIRNQCAAALVPFFFKGWGKWLPSRMVSSTETYSYKQWGWVSRNSGKVDHNLGGPLKDNSHYELMVKIRSKDASRLLDGLAHDELPWRYKS